MLVLFSPVLYGATFGDFTYTTGDDDEIVITGYSGAGGDVDIPAAIGGMPVTAIEYRAFYNSNLTSITIPESVFFIGHSAFSGCAKLTSVNLPPNLPYIYDYAFSDCSSLTDITLPPNLQYLGDSAFSGCSSLTSVSLPPYLEYIGNSAFADCSSLSNVTIPVGVTALSQGMFSSCSGLTDISLPTGITFIGVGAFSNCSSLSNVVIPSGVTAIGASVFSGCSSLTGISLPTGLTSIGEYAFSHSGLTSITLPDSLTSIGFFAFSDCYKLTSIKLPATLTSIDVLAFSKCYGLISIVLPSTVTSIGEAAFADCSNLSVVTLPTGLTTIGTEAFARCYKLAQINFPSGLSTIGDYAFFRCYFLTDIKFPPSLSSIGDFAFYACRHLTEIDFADGLTSIGNSAFAYCDRYLTNITLPASLTSIGTEAFASCSALTEATFLGHAPPNIVSSVFEFGDANLTIYYPAWARGFSTTTWLGYPAQSYDSLVLQAITFNALPNRLIGATFDLTALTTSGLPLSFSILEGPATLGTNGKTVTVGSTSGLVKIRAFQAGGTRNGVVYASAEKVQSFEVTLGPPTEAQTINFTQPTAPTYGDDAIQLIANSSSGLPVSFELVSTVPASGVATLSSDNKTLILQGAGKVTLRATQPGAFPYKPAAPITRTLTVSKAPLAVSFAPATRLVRAANPAFAPIYTGFVNGDTAADLAATRPVGITKANPASPAGDYPITFTGGLDANYAFVPGSPGSLTVEGFSGSYHALLVDVSGTPRGKLELTVPANALTYTGTLNLASEPASLSLRGDLSASDGASATGSFTRAANPAKAISALSLGFELTGDTLDGELSINNTPALSLGSGSRLFVQPVVFGKKQNAPWSGTHTLALRDPVPLDLAPDSSLPAPSSLPLGAGHASAAIASTGLMTLKGKLADGTTLTGTAAADSSGRYHLYVRPYAKRLDSFLAGELPLVAHPEQTRFANRFHVPEGEATLFWAKAASPAKPLDKSYRAGFGPLAVPVTLDPWLPPSAKSTAALPAGTLAQRLGLATDPLSPASLAVSFGTADLDLGNSTGLLPTSLTLSAKGLFTVTVPVTTPANATKFSLKVVPTTGAFSGSFTLSDVRPPATKPTLRPVTFSGTLRQSPEGDTTLGAGFFLLPDFDKTAEQPSADLTLSR